MSFETMDLKDLKKIANEEYGLDVPRNAQLGTVLTALEDEGIRYEDWKLLHPDDEEVVEPVLEETVVQTTTTTTTVQPVLAEPEVLVKMNRSNFRYDILGYTFTKEHPFNVVPESVADQIFERIDGFTMATPKEARDYYN